jgi:hypothetical protein
MTKKNEIEGLNGKQIQISLLSKYDFNIKNRIGTILHSKFDFTSCSGIYDAYTKAFKQIENLDFLKSDNLRLLELSRNLIVHRTGRIDEEYLKLTKRTDINIGDTIDFNFEILAEFSNTTTESFYDLTKAVDKIQDK